MWLEPCGVRGINRVSFFTETREKVASIYYGHSEDGGLVFQLFFKESENNMQYINSLRKNALFNRYVLRQGINIKFLFDVDGEDKARTACHLHKIISYLSQGFAPIPLHLVEKIFTTLDLKVPEYTPPSLRDQCINFIIGKHDVFIASMSHPLLEEKRLVEKDGTERDPCIYTNEALNYVKGMLAEAMCKKVSDLQQGR